MQIAAQPPRLHLIADHPRVHFTLQGKGGVGKSLVSSLLAQYLRSSDKPVRCIDTDPINDTLNQYRALDAVHLDLIRDGRLDERVFDELMERVLSEEESFVVDCGATSFVPLTNYIAENNAFQMIRDQGREVIVHSVITGGQACRDTVMGFKVIAQRSAPNSVVVWLNEYFGPIQIEADSSGQTVRKGFLEMKAYEESRNAVLGIVTLPRRNPDTFGRDVQEMVTQKLTFREVGESPRWSIMAKSRIAAVERELYSQLKAVLG